MRCPTLFTIARAAVLTAVLLAAPASATVFVTSYSVSANYAAGLPFTSLSATYTLRYNDTVSAQQNAVSLAAFSMDLNGVHYDLSNVLEQYLPPGTSPKLLQIAGSLNGFGLAARTNDFTFTFAYLPDYTNSTTGGAFPSPQFDVAAPTNSSIRSATTGSIVVTRLSTFAVPVPEPAAWALMLAGFGLIGAALRRASRAERTRKRRSWEPTAVRFPA